jgi:hypothetical protein
MANGFPTPDPDCITNKTCTTEVITSLAGYHLPAGVETDQPGNCLEMEEADYLERSILLTNINKNWEVLGLCGSTGLGTYWYGCLGGGVSFEVFSDSDEVEEVGSCGFTTTGEKVIAQVCKYQCDELIPFSIGDHATVVLIAQIGGQWFIVNVIDRGFVTHLPEFKTANCEDACCGVGLQELEVEILSAPNCSPLSGEVFRLIGNGNWSGSVTSGGISFAMTVSCGIEEAGAEDWVVTGGCGGGGGGADDFEIECDELGLTGRATFSTDPLTCGGCSQLKVVFKSVPPETTRPCDEVTLTGEEVIMEACGLPLGSLLEGDEVVMAHVPKLGTETETGTGTLITTPQWQMIQVCSHELNCGGPCPSGEGELTSCCCWDDDEVPTTLTGIVSLDSDDPNCVCSAPIVFELDTPIVGGAPMWSQVTRTGCDDTSGAGPSANVLLGITDMIIGCGGKPDTGTGTGTGSCDHDSLSWTLDTDFLGNDSTPNHEATSSCDVILINWSGIETASNLCDGDAFPPDYVHLSLEVAAG